MFESNNTGETSYWSSSSHYENANVYISALSQNFVDGVRSNNNRSDSLSVRLVRPEPDTTDPVIKGVTIGGASVENKGTIGIPGSPATLAVVITATDDGGSGVLEYKITNNATEPIDGWVTASTISHSFTNNASIYIWVRDSAGNVSAGFKVTAEARIYVSSSGNDDTNPGTEASPVATIGKAIALLPATGGTVLVMNEITIAATIEIAKGITLKSSGSCK